jgi:hypothetical protein
MMLSLDQMAIWMPVAKQNAYQQGPVESATGTFGLT